MSDLALECFGNLRSTQSFSVSQAANELVVRERERKERFIKQAERERESEREGEIGRGELVIM
jgi:hypothetical protein